MCPPEPAAVKTIEERAISPIVPHDMLPLDMIFAFYLLNIIQGITEFLPISSSGHLIVAQWLYDVSEPGLEAFLNFPTALAVGVVFFTTFLAILKDRKTWPLLIISAIPAGLVGFFLGDAIDAIFYSPIVVAFNQILWGGIMWHAAVNYHKHEGWTKSDWKQLNWKEALRIGLFQILALIPGTSRSGVTTLAGIWQGLVPSQSAAFSFIAGFPLLAAASGIGLLKVLRNSELLTTLPTTALAGGLLVSFVLGVICVKLFASKHALKVMKIAGIYRIILGILIIVWLT